MSFLFGLMNCTSSVQIIGRLTFTNPNITTHLIQQNIMQTYSNLSHYWKTLIDKVSHNKKWYFAKKMNKTSGQTYLWTESQTNNNLNRRGYYLIQDEFIQLNWLL
jgi:hypothetical protein